MVEAHHVLFTNPPKDVVIPVGWEYPALIASRFSSSGIHVRYIPAKSSVMFPRWFDDMRSHRSAPFSHL